MDADDDPFVVLGIDRLTSDEDTVNAAFRRQALHVHPDKKKKNDDDDDGGTNADFLRIAAARDSALEWITTNNNNVEDLGLDSLLSNIMSIIREAQRKKKDSESNSNNWHPGACDWAIWATRELLSCDRPRTLRIEIKVTLQDVYAGLTKRLGISVLRRRDGGGGDIMESMRQELLVRLRGDVQEHLFSGVGDDAPSTILLGGTDILGKRGDVVVRTVVEEHPVFSVDTVVSPGDIQATLHVNLNQFYNGCTLCLHHLSGKLLEVHYQSAAERTNEMEMLASETRQVRIFHGLGLPCGDEGVRGDLYVFIELMLPINPQNQ